MGLPLDIQERKLESMRGKTARHLSADTARNPPYYCFLWNRKYLKSSSMGVPKVNSHHGAQIPPNAGEVVGAWSRRMTHSPIVIVFYCLNHIHEIQKTEPEVVSSKQGARQTEEAEE